MFLDFQKAFNTVSHDILFKETWVKWFRSFLKDINQHTTVNKARSSDKPISTGVPQGLILGPILFVLFINDFHKAVEFPTVHHFADDTNLLLTEKTCQRNLISTSLET